MRNLANRKQEFWRRGIEFIQVELDIGLTFSGLALNIPKTSKTDPEKRGRNRRNARMAYDSAVRFLPLVRLTRTELDVVEQKRTLLRNRLLKLGEVFDDC